MTFVGLGVTLLGFIVAFISLGVSQSTAVRMVMVFAGIAVSLFGIMGVSHPRIRRPGSGRSNERTAVALAGSCSVRRP